MESNYQTLTENIFTNAIHLQENRKYKELNPTKKYGECNVLIVDHENKTFWFTKNETLEHTNKVIEKLES